jgi:hypothetical protein
MQSATELRNLRVWRDDRMDQLWRVAYNEGEGETVVSFPDTAALGDFILERLGLSVQQEDLLAAYHTYVLEHTIDTIDTIDTDNPLPVRIIEDISGHVTD